MKMDYKTQMDSDDFTYPQFYEERMWTIQSQYVKDQVLGLLSKKRQDGLAKYGEYSFQSSFSNSLKSPVLEHAQEEFLDAINYLSHALFTSEVYGNIENTYSIEDLLRRTCKLLEDIVKLQSSTLYRGV